VLSSFDEDVFASFALLEALDFDEGHLHAIVFLLLYY
jgi:hypothetical protein